MQTLCSQLLSLEQLLPPSSSSSSSSSIVLRTKMVAAAVIAECWTWDLFSSSSSSTSFFDWWHFPIRHLLPSLACIWLTGNVQLQSRSNSLCYSPAQRFPSVCSLHSARRQREHWTRCKQRGKLGKLSQIILACVTSFTDVKVLPLPFLGARLKSQCERRETFIIIIVKVGY